MAQFRLLQGTHTENGVTYTAFRDSQEDSIVPSDENLAEKFPFKFAPVGGDEVDPMRAAASPMASGGGAPQDTGGAFPGAAMGAPPPAEVDAEGLRCATISEGDDVTEDFADAAAVGLKVFHYRGHYTLCKDGDEVSAKAVNEEGTDLSSKRAVHGFVKNYVAEE